MVIEILRDRQKDGRTDIKLLFIIETNLVILSTYLLNCLYVWALCRCAYVSVCMCKGVGNKWSCVCFCVQQKNKKH